MVVGRNGLKDWLIQRATAVILALYSLIWFSLWLQFAPFDYASLKSIFQHPFMLYSSLLTVLCFIFHAWVGLWTISTDYLKPRELRMTAQLLVLLSLALLALWSVHILWRLA